MTESNTTRARIRLGGVALLAACLSFPASGFAKPKPADAPAKAGGGGWTTKVRASRPLSVLLVGNSHLLMPGFMQRVDKRLRARAGRPVKIRTIAKIGTTLTKSRRKAATARILKSRKWNVVVLQESTTAFMTNHGRRNFLAAVKWFAKRKPAGTKLLLWQPWPQGASHALYFRRGVWGRWFKNPPRNPKQLFSWIEAGVRRAANATGAAIAPVGRCWMSLTAAKRPYAGDDYHPSSRGLTFVAEVLARSVVALARGQAKPGRAAGGCP